MVDIALAVINAAFYITLLAIVSFTILGALELWKENK
jgi:hypothetical protein